MSSGIVLFNLAFYVEVDFRVSGRKKQSAGIRQGCPLSPFLFVLVMSVVDRDVSLNLDRRTLNSRLDGVNFDRVYYADDTLLLATTTYATNKLLKEIEEVSRQYGLCLNRSKCCFIAMNGNNLCETSRWS